MNSACDNVDNKAVILFLVFEVERNIYDQRKLEVLISKTRPEVKVIRRDNLEVAVVYQRSCYKPQDFSGGASLWKSQAIMCPSAGYHLAGTKKVQQVLSKPGMLERFVKDTKMRERIRSTFASQYELDRNPAGDKALQMAIENPNSFVVKPQREGGGNNTYGQDIVDLLTSIKDSDERLSFILMERISPMDVLKQQKVKLTEMVSELGVYGVLVGSKSKIIMNEQCGYLLRTKNADTNEGGVATGYSVLDSPYLLD
ncbi:hypothetical protein HELRODRAFT_157658 [Helobdella robusta]|uniref:Glutathione synthetase n=1 Tax=Helobdella robusta TaxID=6412 RepID=T1EME4_HELRO|nr:hypothetical protein HELRODRAFT_157658 [Helobdella robusta]ESN95321.1 hypothetical protein HELRODRAFT_157658 [Helobdella robusta]